ncbi:hypothetical protein MTO96_013329 [Rhipicephalus appendiculatus]
MPAWKPYLNRSKHGLMATPSLADIARSCCIQLHNQTASRTTSSHRETSPRDRSCPRHEDPSDKLGNQDVLSAICMPDERHQWEKGSSSLERRTAAGQPASTQLLRSIEYGYCWMTIIPSQRHPALAPSFREPGSRPVCLNSTNSENCFIGRSV